MFRTRLLPLLLFIRGKSFQKGGKLCRGLKNSADIYCSPHRFVLTDMGIAAATGAGIDLPVTKGEESAKNIIDLISSATRETLSGKFIDVDTREEIPW